MGKLVRGWVSALDRSCLSGWREATQGQGEPPAREAGRPPLPPRGRRGSRRLHAQLPYRLQVLLPVGRVRPARGFFLAGHMLLDQPFFWGTRCDLPRCCKDSAQTSHVSLPRSGCPDVHALCHQVPLSKPTPPPAVLQAVLHFFRVLRFRPFPPPIPAQAATLHFIVVSLVPCSRPSLLFQGDGSEGLPGPFPALRPVRVLAKVAVEVANPCHCALSGPGDIHDLPGGVPCRHPVKVVFARCPP